jgi:hypothetical protein
MSHLSIACLRSGCGGIAMKRGLCLRHYWQLESQIRRGKQTWKQAEKANLCLPCVRGRDGRKRSPADRGQCGPRR